MMNEDFKYTLIPAQSGFTVWTQYDCGAVEYRGVVIGWADYGNEPLEPITPSGSILDVSGIKKLYIRDPYGYIEAHYTLETPTKEIKEIIENEFKKMKNR